REEITTLFSTSTASGLTVASPADNPGQPNGPQTVMALQVGNYVHFLDNTGNSLSVNQNEIATFTYVPVSNYWAKKALTVNVDLSTYSTKDDVYTALDAYLKWYVIGSAT